jgi:hypothetical protein
MTDAEKLIVWREAIQKALYCVPFEHRAEVLKQLTAKHADDLAGPRFKVISFQELTAPSETDGLWNPIIRASSLIVQVLVRSIRNNHSPERASAILFREHREGTGSGWLPDYLDGLPGITIDRDRCIAIAEAEAGKTAA